VVGAFRGGSIRGLGSLSFSSFFCGLFFGLFAREIKERRRRILSVLFCAFGELSSGKTISLVSARRGGHLFFILYSARGDVEASKKIREGSVFLRERSLGMCSSGISQSISSFMPWSNAFFMLLSEAIPK